MSFSFLFPAFLYLYGYLNRGSLPPFAFVGASGHDLGSSTSIRGSWDGPGLGTGFALPLPPLGSDPPGASQCFVSQPRRRGILCAADVLEVELSMLLAVPGG